MPWVYNYIADVNNHCASRVINWKTPIEKRHGYTPDISAFLLYQFWEPVYYLIDEKTSNSKEQKGRWMGISPNVGDCLTYYIYCENTKCVISHSVIRTADPQKGAIINKVIDPIPPNLPNEPERILSKFSDSGENNEQTLNNSGKNDPFTADDCNNDSFIGGHMNNSSTQKSLRLNQTPILNDDNNRRQLS